MIKEIEQHLDRLAENHVVATHPCGRTESFLAGTKAAYEIGVLHGKAEAFRSVEKEFDPDRNAYGNGDICDDYCEKAKEVEQQLSEMLGRGGR